MTSQISQVWNNLTLSTSQEQTTNGGTSERLNVRRRELSRHRRASSRDVVSRLQKDGQEIKEKTKTKEKIGKLGTFSGVFVPTSLNVLSILMFLRFGFILGQSGILGMMAMLIASYIINLVTTLSISAISTNGTVRGGGAYYLISRSLGPEFGGSIGVVFYLGSVFNTGMNAVGLVDCILNNYGEDGGNNRQLLPESFWWNYLYASIILIFCTIICLLGSGIFAKASSSLLVILLVATLSIPFSTLFIDPISKPASGIVYTGLSIQTFKDNFYPRFTKNAAGSQIKGRETFQDLFGILFPATGGIFAGASMSGDLQNPGKSIPTGTLQGLLLTFISYALVIISMGASIARESMYANLNIIQDVNVSSALILAGEFATSFFSALMGVIGSAKLLQALARDNLLPGFTLFGQGTKKADEPVVAIMFTFLLAQVTLFADINQLALFVTMSYLMIFVVTNLACFLLKISSAPNFRPSFHYFRWWTAAVGAVVSAATMFFVDPKSAMACIMVLVVLFLVIHYTTPPKSWGDVSQSLIYHQVRKYLLRLKQEHVKFWRPQILLMVNDPRRSYNLIQFCNSLKKGSLYILGHVIVTPDFQASYPEAKQQQQAWAKYIDFSKVKAFVQIAVSPAIEWGMRNIVLSAGLGGMRPNIAILGMYNLAEYSKRQPLVSLDTEEETIKLSNASIDLQGQLPTDTCRAESSVPITSWVNMLEDLLLSLQINVALARGFSELEMPKNGISVSKKWIDLWPIQMSAEISSDSGTSGSILTTNFNSYTLILQLGCILHTVPNWKKAYRLRVIVFVEYENDVEEERGRVESLLETLRIQAKVVVRWLAKGDLESYEIIVNGKESSDKHINSTLAREDWWAELQKRRRDAELSSISANRLAANLAKLVQSSEWPNGSFVQQGNTDEAKMSKIHESFAKLTEKRRRRRSISGLSKLGMSLGSMNMQTHRLLPDEMDQVGSGSSDESSSSESEDEDSDNESNASVSAASENDVDELRRTSAGRINSQFTRQDLPKRSNTGDFDVGITHSDSAEHDLDSPTSKKSSRRSSLKGSSRKARESIKADRDLILKATATDKSDVPQISISPGEPSNSNASSSSNTVAHTSSSTTNLRSPLDTLRRPALLSRASNPTFTSKMVPQTQVADSEDATGPTIMFADQTQGSPVRRASGYPSQQAIPLSFNDLPSMAQHLILNELIRKHSKNTAVLFTTLPSPVAGTYKSEEACLDYIRALDILCKDLPPVLLVHSNSMTVTMAL